MHPLLGAYHVFIRKGVLNIVDKHDVKRKFYIPLDQRILQTKRLLFIRNL